MSLAARRGGLFQDGGRAIQASDVAIPHSVRGKGFPPAAATDVTLRIARAQDGEAFVGQIQLVENIDNQPGTEALYVENLTVRTGSYLGLDGLNLYYLNAVIDPGATIGGGVPTQVPVIPGDANLDGVVNVGDLGILGANYGESARTWRTGDFNCDGIVNVGDLGILGANYNGGGGSPAVPEPGTIALVFLGALGLLQRRVRTRQL